MQERQEKLEQRSFILALLLVTLAFALLLLPFFKPIFWACAIALIFHPVHRRLLARFPNWRNLVALATLLLCVIAVVIPVLVVASAFVREGIGLYQQLQAGNIDLSSQVDQLRRAFPGASGMIERAGIDLEQIKQQLLGWMMSAGSFLARHAITLGQNTLGFLMGLGLMLYLTFFLIRDGESLVQLIVRALPLGDEREQLLIAKFAEVTRATIKGNMVVAAIQGALGGLIFWILGLPGAVLWGVIMAVLSLLPAVGASLIWFPAALLLYATGDVFKATVLIIFGLVVISLVDNVLRPILVGRDTKLPDYLVLFSTIGGLFMFGISGFAIGPLLAALFLAFWGIFMREFNPHPEKENEAAEG